eukprot:1722625-Rhodomonas_salina.3
MRETRWSEADNNVLLSAELNPLSAGKPGRHPERCAQKIWQAQRSGGEQEEEKGNRIRRQGSGDTAYNFLYFQNLYCSGLAQTAVHSPGKGYWQGSFVLRSFLGGTKSN